MSLSVPKPRHAVVIGGSFAGLCAARALTEHVDQVTVVDRDRFSDGPQARKGVPQAHHLHILITAGQRALDRLFPGLMAELRELGAVPVITPTDILQLGPTGWRERGPATHVEVGASRGLIDWVTRQRLMADERVRFLTGQEVVGLVPAEGGSGIAGVELRARNGHPGNPQNGEAGVERLAADLVVDASGRGSHTADWLEGLGYGRPKETRVDAGLGYASRRVRLREGVANGWKNIRLMPEPPRSARGGVVYPIENDRWMVTLLGLGDDRPPTDEAGFMEFTRNLSSPLLYEAIKDAEPDGPIHGFRQTANQRRYYETMARWPDGLLVVGDAACSFNPIYGQGMTVAAHAALVIDEHLRSHPGVFGRAAQAAVARCGTTAWTISTGADLRFPTTVGAKLGRAGRLSHWYLDRMSDVANHDSYICHVLTDVLHLVEPPTALIRPRVALRVLRGRSAPVLSSPPEAAVVAPPR